MYRNKKDVDKHVENLISKLSVKEFKNRAYSVARLYFEVGDYASCQKYVEQYLTQKDNNAAAYKLLGQALQKLGQKEKALEQYKTSLDIDPSQTSTILEICELLADDEVVIEPGRAKYWCEKAEATFPKHPVTFRLREKLVTMLNPDPDGLINLLTAELTTRPKDVLLHIRLLKHYMHTNKVKEAFDHSCNLEFGGNAFFNNYAWYEILSELLKNNSHNVNDWLYQLFLLTVRERLCMLSLTETPAGTSKGLVESNELLHNYDQAIESVARAGAPPSFGEFHSGLLQHHRGQFVFHAATYLLKKAKKDQLSWHDATKYAAPLMLMAWHTAPLDTKVNWLKYAPEKQVNAVNRWYLEGTYRCSQSGHYLLSNIQDKSQSFLDNISQCCSGTHWREKLFGKVFTTKGHSTKIKSSHFVSNEFNVPVLRLPRKTEVQAYDSDAQRQYGNSLHHFVWILLNYKNYADFKCTLFNMLTPTVTSCGPETLNELDIYAFLYCATLTARQQKSSGLSYISSDKPVVLPANITNLLCPFSQMKWWDCAYKFSQNELGTELTDIRATLSRGIEVVRCIDNHGIDPELLCTLGHIFSERAKLITAVDDKSHLEARARLYYSSAIPILEKLKRKVIIKLPEKRLFDYNHKDLGSRELNALIEECKLYVAFHLLNECEYDKVIEMLSGLKTPQAYYQLSLAYKKIALEENRMNRGSTLDSKSKLAALLSKAKSSANKALDQLKETESYKTQPLYTDIQELIEDIETHVYKIDPELSDTINNDVDGKYLSDENVSVQSELVHARTYSNMLRNLSSTPKATTNPNSTNYRTAVESQLHETTRTDQKYFERIEKEIKNLQKRDSTISEFMDQTRNWFEDNRKLGNQIISTINSNIQNTTDQFKLLKISVDQVKDQIDECRNECKDVGVLKKEIADLKKEVYKLKKASSEQAIDESNLYNLDEDYKTNDSTTFTAQLPFTPPQVIPPFNQRLVHPFPVPPNPYQLYGQSLYNLYNQYSQFSQPTSVPGAAPPIFDPTRAQVNYAGVYSTPDQMYLDVAHLVPPTGPAVPTVPAVPVVPTLPTVPMSTVSVAPVTITGTTAKPVYMESKETSRALPVNVVITSSDPLPTCTTAPAPVLSVTIPQKHIKGTPHNYQIPMPSISDSKVVSPPVFSFPKSGSKNISTASPLSIWNQSSTNKTTQPSNMTAMTSNTLNNSSVYLPKMGDGDTPNTSKTFGDGFFSGYSPNTSNKSRTLSERSNTSVENYDPCPDFKPIIPLPDEVKVTTGEENESVIFCSRAKLFRFVDKQWKERGIGEMKLLKHNVTGKVRVLMRREQIHKICANHMITSDMEIKPMQNETKAYFWVANDFADETVNLEKFCVRFKTVDIALEFYNTFEKARQEFTSNMSISKENTHKSGTSKSIPEKTSTPVKSNIFSSSVAPNKPIVGGFTFSSTPTFKSVSDDLVSNKNTQEPPSSKVNVFSTLTFKTATSSPFSNLFNTKSTLASDSTSTKQNQELSNKLNTSDTVEEFEPNVEFKPVVPLPALVEQKTGEEDENILFEHRAKLLRFDISTKEWKERGLGNIKLLVHKDNIHKVRLLMRREQIMKVCCNHAITKDMLFQKMPNMDKAVTWCAKDFSDGELVAETFCLRFKTIETCDKFVEVVKVAQSKMKDESKAAKEEKNAAKQTNQTGFGDMFKAKPGSWSCETCYTNNLETFDKCACCEQPKPQSGVKDTNTTAIKFSFGISSETTSSNQIKKEVSPTVTSTVASGWGDKFKPKEGTWECQCCFVRNENHVESCSACNSPKDPNSIKKENTKSLFGNLTGPKFTFGIPAMTNDQKSKTDTSSIFDGTGAHKFSFGIPSTADKVSNISVGTTTKTAESIVFGIPKESSNNTDPLDFSVNNNEKDNTMITPIKPPLLPTPQTGTPSDSFATKDNGTFGFVFKPKTPTKGKSPIKSPKSENGDESDEECVCENDNISFNPVIPLPDEVEVITGEENETELYGHRAKLYRFISGEWKERGVGIIKILKHKDTGKLRVVMRREQVLKICLNHALTPDVTYTTKDEKTWLFTANDFSEGELSLQRFCLRFKNKEIALEFRDAIDAARGQNVKNSDASEQKENASDDVIFVTEIQATAEEKQKAKELMLPENFFTYKDKDPCRGCRGCKDEDDEINNSKPNFVLTSVSTPAKSTPSSFQTSIYGTPATSDKTSDVSIFRTPLGSIGSNSKSTTIVNNNNDASNTDSTNKENTFGPKTIFSGFGEQISKFGSSQIKPDNFSGAGDTQTSTISKNSLLAPPKLSSLNISGDEKQSVSKSVTESTQPKSIFGETKSIFGSTTLGATSTKSIFGFSADSNKVENQNTEVKSFFATDGKKTNSLFGGSQGSIFGSTLTNTQSKPGIGLFGLSNISTLDKSKTEVFGSGNSGFGETSNQTLPWSLGVNKEQNKPNLASSVTTEKTNEVKTDNEAAPLFKVDNDLLFTSLSTSGDAGFTKNPNFQWEGAGQKLFVAPKQSSQNIGNKSDNDCNTGNEADESTGADEEYDPHYEPIVPLPEKIVVTTGEEDEEKLFGERCKLFRYDEKAKEWKERGVGEMKILYHPGRNTYRLLLRRELIHKAVLNMLLFMDFELLPMTNSDRAWTWAGCNFAETSSGEQEKLAVRFKSTELANKFQQEVVKCVRKLQAAAAQAIQNEKATDHKEFESIAPLRLPKHLGDNARADNAIFATVAQITQTTDTAVESKSNGEVNKTLTTIDMFKQVQFQEPQEEEQDDDEEDYDAYYNEDDEDSTYYSSYDGEAVIKQSESQMSCPNARILVTYNQETYTPKIMVTDAGTGEILADMLIYADTEFQLTENTCTWSGTDYTSNNPLETTVTVNFFDSDTAMQFYDNCETSKATT